MAEITLLDGGMGQELIRRSGKPAAPLWSTQVMIDHPGLVGEIHADYADAGATVATVNSYAIHRDRLLGGNSNHYASDDVKLPNLEHMFEAFHSAALTEADTVRDRSRIAGSVGPLGASYRSDIHPAFDDALPLYAEVVHLLAPRSDIILFETIASVEAAKACLAAGRQSDKPVWLSFTVSDEDGSRLRSGEPLSDALDIIREADTALANCSVPEVMPAALDVLARGTSAYGACANAFTKIETVFIEGGATADSLSARQDMTPEAYADHAMAWIDQGATLVGGCCETGPAHIAAIADRVKAAGHTLV